MPLRKLTTRRLYPLSVELKETLLEERVALKDAARTMEVREAFFQAFHQPDLGRLIDHYSQATEQQIRQLYEDKIQQFAAMEGGRG